LGTIAVGWCKEIAKLAFRQKRTQRCLKGAECDSNCLLVHLPLEGIWLRAIRKQAIEVPLMDLHQGDMLQD